MCECLPPGQITLTFDSIPSKWREINRMFIDSNEDFIYISDRFFFFNSINYLLIRIAV